MLSGPASLTKEVGDLTVTSLERKGQGRLSVLCLRVDVRAVREEQFHDLRISVRRGLAQGRQTILVYVVHIRAMGEEEFHDDLVVARYSPGEGRESCRRCHEVHVGPLGEEELHRLGLAKVRGEAERWKSFLGDSVHDLGIRRNELPEPVHLSERCGLVNIES